MRRRGWHIHEAILCLTYSVAAWVPGRLGVYLREVILQSALGQAGAHLRFEAGIRISGWENISLGDGVNMMRFGVLQARGGQLNIGKNVSINTNVCIDASDGGHIDIGDDVLIAQNVVIRAADHRHDRMDISIHQQGHAGGDILIGKGAWIGANVVVTRNTRIGEHAIVGAGSVVTQDVAAFTIVGGVPAKLIRSRAVNQNG